MFFKVTDDNDNITYYIGNSVEFYIDEDIMSIMYAGTMADSDLSTFNNHTIVTMFTHTLDDVRMKVMAGQSSYYVNDMISLRNSAKNFLRGIVKSNIVGVFEKTEYEVVGFSTECIGEEIVLELPRDWQNNVSWSYYLYDGYNNKAISEGELEQVRYDIAHTPPESKNYDLAIELMEMFEFSTLDEMSVLIYRLWFE